MYIYIYIHVYGYAYMCIYLYMYAYKIKLATLVVGEQKAPNSIATTLRCRGGCYSFP